MKLNDIITAYIVLKDSKMSKVETSGKLAIIKLTKEMKNLVADFEELRNELYAKEENAENATNTLRNELNKEIELTNKLSENTIEQLIESNDWSVEEAIAVIQL